jgi:hypothetical protein
VYMSGIYTTILVKKPTREILRQIGHKNQTYDDIISALLKKEQEQEKRGSSD